ncbi:MAG TPA: hypothetical protein VKB18_04920 [Gemmatimonadota bacterium]|nr:hypothetical protein [Gemmatimonadota bacterium]
MERAGDLYFDVVSQLSTSVRLSASFRPSPNVQVSLGPRYACTASRAQFVTSVADPTSRRSRICPRTTRSR